MYCNQASILDCVTQIDTKPRPCINRAVSLDKVKILSIVWAINLVELVIEKLPSQPVNFSAMAILLLSQESVVSVYLGSIATRTRGIDISIRLF